MAKTDTKTTEPRLKSLYKETVLAQLKKDLKLANVHQVPKLEKIILNIGLGKGKDDKRMIATAVNTLGKITGQAPVKTIAKQSIAGFKVREGSVIGLKVTLRGDRMYEFYDRLVSIALPRLRDFHGVSNKSFDPQGNFSLGLNDQSVFPELSFEETTMTHGLQVNIVSTSSDKEASKALLAALGMPFMKENK